MIVRLLRLFFFVSSMWHLFRVILVMLMLYSCVTGKRGYGLSGILSPCSLALSLVTIACRRADVNINSGAETAVLERYFVDAAGAFFMLACRRIVYKKEKNALHAVIFRKKRRLCYKNFHKPLLSASCTCLPFLGTV